ncbi:MAG: hypothetical protein A3G02_01875 [Candidatus Yanofskybacteria bacterium RIFCSPLOWO2_12_FULL_44_13b]|uniref:Uncharacterized protein n=2 Tax=Candidatus Yanofskyibacteriota TaxID=1752733 RepID=A0A1F8H2T4_9BACT|nr:MAG: hypothetical protein UW14_C0016G0005 [Candidatus Yanofskybacteria bacterium GW2011_GWA2_44_10]KKT90363.1 MAG: hypothetical protein UW90_C0002G0012 [Candidatus Yanofskybacteria bacterium GW2011_GWB1_45_11]OGN03270.1 MAG: hypothetical protein A2657_00070 [Candidatus Yanofskybacteria bacterium RIFCSPHIGHO2_01_FULL_44_110b]OGN14911.1 MAG: hypothetical protein A3C01_02285 [Candidatus Yanofskybacteria bacterium RIFCSPHIGHO2_02_FULL_44_36b]OGN18429.1 MAG: hypothetical protein A3F50_01355 [Cand
MTRYLANLPAGKPITVQEVNSIVHYLADFLIIISLVLAVIMLTISGIRYMTAAGSPDRIKKAQATLKNAIIGTFIIMGTGVIINTIYGIVTRNFFCRVGFGGICIF